MQPLWINIIYSKLLSTCFEGWPAHSMREVIFFSKFNFGLLCLRRVAVQVAITGCDLGLGTHVLVAWGSMLNKTCTMRECSALSWSFQNFLRPCFHRLDKDDSDVIDRTSLHTCFPSKFTRTSWVKGSSTHSRTIIFWLLWATYSFYKMLSMGSQTCIC